MKRRRLIAAMSAAALTACTSYPPPVGGTTGPMSRTTAAGVLADVVFTALERQIIRDYYRRNLPPGLARRESLPPGLRRQLVRNGRLPPGLEKRALPADLRARLPARDPRYDIVRVGTDVLLILIATGVILDIIQDVPS